MFKNISSLLVFQIILLNFVLFQHQYAQAPDTLWTKTYGLGGDDRGRSVIETTNGEFIIAGYTDSFGAGMNHIRLLL